MFCAEKYLRAPEKRFSGLTSPECRWGPIPTARSDNVKPKACFSGADRLD